MILKEAFRNQNFLSELIDSAISYLINTDNVVNKEQEHFRTKVNKEAEDEKVVMPKANIFENKNIVPNTVVSFVMDLIDEKDKLTNAITVAKRTTEVDIDSAISLNKTKQNVSSVFERMSNIKGNERVIPGLGYKFNGEGSQVTYRYDIKETTTIDFNRASVKALTKKLRNECDEVSAKIDLINVMTQVDYTPVYEIGDSFEDCIVKFFDKSKLNN